MTDLYDDWSIETAKLTYLGGKTQNLAYTDKGKSLRRWSQIFIIFLTAFLIGCVTADLLECRPLSMLWLDPGFLTKSWRDYCIDLDMFIYCTLTYYHIWDSDHKRSFCFAKVVYRDWWDKLFYGYSAGLPTNTGSVGYERILLAAFGVDRFDQSRIDSDYCRVICPWIWMSLSIFLPLFFLVHGQLAIIHTFLRQTLIWANSISRFARIGVFYQNRKLFLLDLYYDIPVFNCSIIELALGMICASIPGKKASKVALFPSNKFNASLVVWMEYVSVSWQWCSSNFSF